MQCFKAGWTLFKLDLVSIRVRVLQASKTNFVNILQANLCNSVSSCRNFVKAKYRI